MDYEKKEVMYKIQRVCKTEDRRVTPFKGQVFAELKKECLRSGRLFEDPVFPASDRSMFYTQSVPYGAVWKRPPDICAKPAFVIGTANQNDLDQGYLGDCKHFKTIFIRSSFAVIYVFICVFCSCCCLGRLVHCRVRLYSSSA